MEDEFEDQELERISEGQAPSPKFRGGPTPEEIPEFEMSRRRQSDPVPAGSHETVGSSAAINHE